MGHATFLWLLFSQCIFFHLSTFSLVLSLNLSVSLAYHICLDLAFCIQSESLHSSFGMFRPFTFTVIHNMFGFTFSILLFVSSHLCFSVSHSLLSFVLNKYFWVYHLNSPVNFSYCVKMYFLNGSSLDFSILTQQNLVETNTNLILVKYRNFTAV